MTTLKRKKHELFTITDYIPAIKNTTINTISTDQISSKKKRGTAIKKPSQGGTQKRKGPTKFPFVESVITIPDTPPSFPPLEYKLPQKNTNYDIKIPILSFQIRFTERGGICSCNALRHSHKCCLCLSLWIDELCLSAVSIVIDRQNNLDGSCLSLLDEISSDIEKSTYSCPIKVARNAQRPDIVWPDPTNTLKSPILRYNSHDMTLAIGTTPDQVMLVPRRALIQQVAREIKSACGMARMELGQRAEERRANGLWAYGDYECEPRHSFNSPATYLYKLSPMLPVTENENYLGPDTIKDGPTNAQPCLCENCCENYIHTTP